MINIRSNLKRYGNINVCGGGSEGQIIMYAGLLLPTFVQKKCGGGDVLSLGLCI